MGSCSGQSGGSYDLFSKILLVSDSGVGKSSLLVSFISSSVEDLAPTIDQAANSRWKEIEAHNLGNRCVEMELVLGGDSRRTCNPCVDEVEWWSMEQHAAAPLAAAAV
ncbi:hypothetical protein SLEP1_g53324 [Rubroshorea leprosula]|uniref:Uncharacterized protein n=1 Tax=Rubroshorea leprosula TaxID=152421 RepID=A0AAV5MBW6_9ROSI|nr:hypothetical protein SLEP1_g53324 [Rubroshorea leprosula]